MRGVGSAANHLHGHFRSSTARKDQRGDERENKRMSVLVLRHFSLSLSLLILSSSFNSCCSSLFALSLVLAQASLRIPFLKYIYVFFFRNQQRHCFLETCSPSALLNAVKLSCLGPIVTITSNQLMNLLPLCCSDAICVCSPHATPVLWLPTLRVPPLPHPLLLLH